MLSVSQFGSVSDGLITPHGDDDDDEDKDDSSQSSSSLYAEEPFNLYQTRVTHRFLQLIPGVETTPAKIDVIRRRGGGLNRITEIIVINGTEEKKKEENGEEVSKERYIWRSPRSLSNDVTRSSLLLSYILAHTPIPVPIVYAFSGRNSELEDRFTLMSLLDGERLDDVLGSMSLEMRAELAEKWADMMADIHEIEMPLFQAGHMGDICVERGGRDEDVYRDHQHQKHNKGAREEESQGHLAIKSFPESQTWEFDAATSPNASDRPLVTETMTLRQFVLHRFHIHRAWAEANSNQWLVWIYTRLIAVADELLSPGRLNEVDQVKKSVVVQGDLEPRNILVRLEQAGGCRPGEDKDSETGCGHGRSHRDEGTGFARRLRVTTSNCNPGLHSSTSSLTTLEITGVLDWDNVQAWPPLAAYVSSDWLWTSDPPLSLTHSHHHPSSPYDLGSDPSPDPDMALPPSYSAIRDRFITTIERRTPGYMSIIRQGRKIGIRHLTRFASTRITSTWEMEGVTELERQAEMGGWKSTVGAFPSCPQLAT